MDIYTAADGMVWQNIDEYSVNDARVWKYYYNYVGQTTFAIVNNLNVLQFTTVKAGEGNTNYVGIRLRALHSKEYYVMMSEKYSAITFDVTPSGSDSPNIGLNGGNGDGNTWHRSETTKTYSIEISYLLEKWDEKNDITTVYSSGTVSTSDSMFMYTLYGKDGETVINIGNFGCVEKTAEAE